MVPKAVYIFNPKNTGRFDSSPAYKTIHQPKTNNNKRIMAIDTRTAAQKKRDALHQTIVGEYLALRKQAPEASAHRIMCIVAEKYDMTSGGIRRILVENKML